VKVSVVAPVKNEAGTIERLIFSLAAQTVRPDEVIVVDGGSTDGTAEIAEAWVRKHKLDGWIRIIRLSDATPGMGRNAGVSAARNEWIAFTDAGIRVEAAWLERLTEAARRDDAVDVVYGSYEPVTENWVAQCSALAYVEPKQERLGQPMRGPFIASSMMRRGVWEGVGGFPDYRAAEDLVFMDAIEKKAYRIAWAPRATVWWDLQPTLSDTFQRMALHSHCHVRAGRQASWHYRIAGEYLIGAALVLVAMIFCAWALALPVLGYGVRVARKIWLRREGRGVLWALSPLRFAGVMLVLLIVDVALFAGWGGSVLKRPGLRRASIAEQPLNNRQS
jgi:glycosyltransferase involved in cell wall biosynthesis